MKTLRDVIVFLDNLFVIIVGLFILYTVYMSVTHYLNVDYEVVLTVHNNREEY